MMILLIAGIVGFFIVQALIDYRCKQEPGAAMCQRAQKS